MTTLGAYGDDSQEGRIQVVAAYLAKPDIWARFERRWERSVCPMLKRRGIPFFHMREFVHPKSRYRGWPSEERREVFSHIVNIVRDCTERRIAIAVDLPGYRACMKSFHRRGPLGPLSAYSFAVIECMRALRDATREAESPEIAYVFDAANEFWRVWDLINRGFRFPGFREALGLGTIAPGVQIDYPELQASDVFAYCVKEYINGPSAACRPCVDMLATVPHQIIYLHTPQHFERLRRILDIGNDLAGLVRRLRRRGVTPEPMERDSEC